MCDIKLLCDNVEFIPSKVLDRKENIVLHQIQILSFETKAAIEF